jgi:hypothetical protein
MGKKLTVRLAEANRQQNDELQHLEFRGPSRGFWANGQAKLRVLPVLTSLDNFELLPATSIAAGADQFFVLSGTGTEIMARAAKGGFNMKSQSTTPADNDNVLVVAADNTGFKALINAKTRNIFETRVAITNLAESFYSIGLNENPTDADPLGTAGEGAMFVFDPTGEFAKIANGFATDGSANWLLAHKVNGTDTFTDTGVKVVAAQDYDLRIEIGIDLKAKFYIDNELVGTGPALTDGDSMRTMFGLELTATPAGQKDLDVRYALLSREIG